MGNPKEISHFSFKWHQIPHPQGDDNCEIRKTLPWSRKTCINQTDSMLMLNFLSMGACQIPKACQFSPVMYELMSVCSHCSYLLVSPTKTLYSNTQQIGIHSQITRKSLNNHLPWFTLCFSGLVLAQLSTVYFRVAIKLLFWIFCEQRSTSKNANWDELSHLTDLRQLSEVGTVRFPAAENFSYHCAGYRRALPTMPFYKHTRLKCVWNLDFDLWTWIVI